MKLTKQFRCVPPGEIYPVDLAAGDDCPKEYEASARAQGCLNDESDKQRSAREEKAAAEAAEAAEREAAEKAAAEAADREAAEQAAAEAAEAAAAEAAKTPTKATEPSTSK
jgi:hypothetical protein